jgi:hypothetical protein
MPGDATAGVLTRRKSAAPVSGAFPTDPHSAKPEIGDISGSYLSLKPYPDYAHEARPLFEPMG